MLEMTIGKPNKKERVDSENNNGCETALYLNVYVAAYLGKLSQIYLPGLSLAAASMHEFRVTR